MPGAIIELNGLTKRYDRFTAVDHLNLAISRGEVFGLLGPNGAGKSTTILMILGLTEPDEGTIRVADIDPVRQPVEVKKKVGYLPEDVGFYNQYSGLDNLIFTGRLNGLSEREARNKADSLLDRVGLSEQKNKKTGIYSRGMRQRLGLADVLMKNPEVIILDEPIMGIDPSGVRNFLGMIVNLSKEENITVLFSSHQLYQVQQVCDRVGLFVGGKLLAEGNIAFLSEKLFGDSPYTVEVGVSSGSHELKKSLQRMEGVLNVKEHRGKLLIECSRDVTSDISKAILRSGAGLVYLNKKEYGLDDIYYRYFEGGMENEKR